MKDKGPGLKSKKSGWFSTTGWFGSGTAPKESAELSNKPIKVKLGEENSFYFDKEKGKWINKKADPAEQEKAHAPPPPPPRGPPSRAVSAAGAPPPRAFSATPPVPPLPMATPTPPIQTASSPYAGPPSQPPSNTASKVATPALDDTLNPGGGVGPSNASGPPSGPPSAPPSRPATGQGGGNSIDDLIGAPQARKGGTMKKAKKGRGYVDVMAK